MYIKAIFFTWNRFFVENCSKIPEYTTLPRIILLTTTAKKIAKLMIMIIVCSFRFKIYLDRVIITTTFKTKCIREKQNPIMNKSFGEDNKHLEWNNIRAEQRREEKAFPYNPYSQTKDELAQQIL